MAKTERKKLKGFVEQVRSLDMEFKIQHPHFLLLSAVTNGSYLKRGPGCSVEWNFSFLDLKIAYILIDSDATSTTAIFYTL